MKRSTENSLIFLALLQSRGLSFPFSRFLGWNCPRSSHLFTVPDSSHLTPSFSVKIWKARWDFLFSGDYLGSWWCLPWHMLGEPLQVVQVAHVKAWLSSPEQLLLQPFQYPVLSHHLVLSKSAYAFVGLVQLPRYLQIRSGHQTWGALYKQILRSVWCLNNLKTFQKLFLSKNNLGDLKWFNLMPHWAHYTCAILWKEFASSKEGFLFYFSLMK